MNERLTRILADLAEGKIRPEEAASLISPSDDLGFAVVDVDRESRTGFAEVIYGEGKSVEQIVAIFERLVARSRRVLATRVSADAAAAVLTRFPDARHNRDAATLSWRHRDEPLRACGGYVAIVSAGTTDLRVAEEAAESAEACGCEARRFYDVGVAGIHRLFDKLAAIRSARAIVVVAGMEGALASVVAGLVAQPVFAVPTSVGYGASFGGLAALLAMLNACAPGVSVVNIDNGFGAGYNAAMVARIAEPRSDASPATNAHQPANGGRA